MQGYNQYRDNQIMTASPEQILLMLYDGAIRFTRLAISGIADNDMAAKGKYIGKSMAIISEFANTLDHDVGGQIASDLDALYLYMLKELSVANINNEIKPLENVVTMLQDLRSTWAEAIEINNQQNRSSEFTSESNQESQATTLNIG